MQDDDHNRHKSNWFKCLKCGKEVRATKDKLCENCKREEDYKRRKEKRELSQKN